MTVVLSCYVLGVIWHVRYSVLAYLVMAISETCFKEGFKNYLAYRFHCLYFPQKT